MSKFILMKKLTFALLVFSFILSGNLMAREYWGYLKDNTYASENVQDAIKLVRNMAFPVISNWCYNIQDIENAWAVNLNDTDWKINEDYDEVLCAEQSWFRAQIIMPETICYQDVKGKKITLVVDVQGTGEVYINGSKAGDLAYGENIVTIAAKATPGRKYQLAVRVNADHKNVIFREARLELPEWREAVAIASDAEIALYTCNRLLGLDTYQRGYVKDLDPGVDKSDLSRAERDKLNKQYADAAGILDAESVKKGNPKAFIDSYQRMIEAMPDVVAYVKSYKLYLVSNAHIDLAWLWRWKETVQVAYDTFTNALDLMEKYPDLHFSQSQAQLYEFMEEYHPEVFDRIKRRVDSDNWEIVGGLWVEPDCNLISGESWVRQLLYGQRYFNSRFGKYTVFGWNPDSFGYNWNMPQFFSKAGIKFFLTQKLLWNDTNDFPYHLFWWKAPDGSKIIGCFPYTGYCNNVNPFQMVDDIRQMECNNGMRKAAVMIGYGDHGGGPKEDMLLRARRLQSHPLYPQVEFSTIENFVSSLSDSLLAELPVYEGELYLEYHRGTYTTQAKIKEYNRKLQTLLTETEKLASLNSLLTGAEYPAGKMYESWKGLMFNQMHDILPGSGIKSIYYDAVDKYEKVDFTLETIRAEALKNLAANTDTRKVESGEALIAFNTLDTGRGGLVRVEGRAGDFDGVSVKALDGNPVTSQVVNGKDYEKFDTRELVFRASDIPATGYKVYSLVKDGRNVGSGGEIVATDSTLENQYLKVKIDKKTGCVVSLFDKTLGREMIRKGGVGNLIELFEDHPKYWDAWNIGYTGKSWKLDKAEAVELTESGPVRATIKVKRSFFRSHTGAFHPDHRFLDLVLFH